MKRLFLVANLLALIPSQALAQGAKGVNQMSPQEFFNRLNRETLHLVDEFYAPDVVFKDSVTELKGSEAVKAHYRHQYEGVTSIRWDFRSEVKQASSSTMEWTMILKHPALNGGEEYSVEGMSMLRFNDEGKVSYHRDYFDVGDFVYSRVPVLKWIDAFVKRRLGAPENQR